MLVGYSGGTAYDVSGGFTNTFTTTSDGYVTLEFDYSIAVTNNEYESDEYGEVWAWVDGMFIGDAYGSDGVHYIDYVRGEFSTSANGSYTVTIPLSAGTHTLILGGYNNKSTWEDETITVCFDNVRVSESSASTIHSSTFNSNSDGFTYVKGPFQSFNNPSGELNRTDGGWNSGYLRLNLRRTSQDVNSGYEYTFTLTESRLVILTFDYYINNSNAESDEYAYLLVTVDGNYYGDNGSAPSYYVDVTNSDLDWTTTTLNLGTLSPGMHTLVIGGYNNELDGDGGENYQFRFDNLTIE